MSHKNALRTVFIAIIYLLCGIIRSVLFSNLFKGNPDCHFTIGIIILISDLIVMKGGSKINKNYTLNLSYSNKVDF